MQEYIKGAEAVSLFCRINMTMKRDIPIRPSEMGMLIYIVKSDKKVTPLEVAKFFKITKPMVTSMSNSLLKQGYINKDKSIEDGRSVELSATEKAKDLVDKTYEEYLKTMKVLQEQLGNKKYSELIELLDAANQILLEERKNG